MEHDQNDVQLLREYAATGSHRAFAQLLNRNIDLVYAAARRQCRGDSHLADDITQAVFIVLARKAATIRSAQLLPAWLISTTRYTARNAITLEIHRRQREQEAAIMAATSRSDDPVAGPDAMARLLDEGLAKLGTIDRAAVTMRFLQSRSFREVGAALGVSEEAASKRVSRALGKLRTFFHRRSVILESETLEGGLARQAEQLAPAALSAAVIQAMTVGGATSALAEVTLKTTTAATKICLVAAVLLVATVGAVVATRNASQGPNFQATAASPAAARALPGSPLVPVDNEPPNAVVSDQELVFPNSDITPIGGGDSPTYTFGDDEQIKRLPDSDPSVFIASRNPDAPAGLMPGMRGSFVSAADWQGKRVQVSAWLKTQNIRHCAQMSVMVWGPNNLILTSNMDGGRLKISGSQDWKRISSVLDVPADATRIEFGIKLWGGGQIWLDSFAIAPVPETVPLTNDAIWHLSTHTPAKVLLTNDPSEPRNGHATARIESHVANESAALVRFERNVEEYRGKTIRLRAMIKSLNVTAGAGIFAKTGHFDAQRRFTETATKAALPVRGTKNWMNYTVTLNVPSDADWIEHGIRFDGTGTIWIDDIALEVVP